MSLAISFHFLCAQHVSDINISIIRSLRLFCWITTLVVLFLVRCVLEFRCVWVGVVSVLQAEAVLQLATRINHSTWFSDKLPLAKGRQLKGIRDSNTWIYVCDVKMYNGSYKNYNMDIVANMMFPADLSGHTVKAVGLRRLTCWDCGFECRRTHWMSVCCEFCVL